MAAVSHPAVKCGIASCFRSHEAWHSTQRASRVNHLAAQAPCPCLATRSVRADRSSCHFKALRGTCSGLFWFRSLSSCGSAAMAANVPAVRMGSGSGGRRHTFTLVLEVEHRVPGGTPTAAVGASTKAALPNTSLKLSPNGGPRGPGRRYPVHFRQPGPRVPPSVPA